MKIYFCKQLILSLLLIFAVKYSIGQKLMVDRVIATVGDKIILQSDIENQVLQFVSHIHYDILKWEIPDYSRDNVEHRNQLQKQMMLLIEQKLREGKSILIEGLDIKLFEVLKNTYEPQFGIFAIKMISDKKVLVKRFEERLERAKNSKKKISNKSLVVFLELYEKYNNAPELGITIDTSDTSIAETQAKVQKYINF